MTLRTHRTARGYGLGQQGTAIMGSAGSTLLTIAPLTGVAAPFVALAGSITQLLAAVGIGSGCGQACIAATSYANQAEVLLRQNLSMYQAIATPRPQSVQQAALANFDKIWTGLQVSCAGVPGGAGQRCIGDRQAGACHFKDSSGNCWNWFMGYRDPIANDTNTYNDSVTPLPVAAVNAAPAASTVPASTAVSPVPMMATGDYSSLLLIGGGLLLVLFVVSQL